MINIFPKCCVCYKLHYNNVPGCLAQCGWIGYLIGIPLFMYHAIIRLYTYTNMFYILVPIYIHIASEIKFTSKSFCFLIFRLISPRYYIGIYIDVIALYRKSWFIKKVYPFILCYILYRLTTLEICSFPGIN